MPKKSKQNTKDSEPKRRSKGQGEFTEKDFQENLRSAPDSTTKGQMEKTNSFQVLESTGKSQERGVEEKLTSIERVDELQVSPEREETKGLQKKSKKAKKPREEKSVSGEQNDSAGSLEETKDSEDENEKLLAEVRDSIKRMNRRVLEQEYEELAVEHQVSQAMLKKELEQERSKNNLLQEELNQIGQSQLDSNQKVETDVSTEKELMDNDLQKEIQSLKQRVSEDQEVIENLQDDNKYFLQRAKQRMSVLKKKASKREEELLKELQELRDKVVKDEQIISTLSSEKDALQENMREEINAVRQNALKKEEDLLKKMEELKQVKSSESQQEKFVKQLQREIEEKHLYQNLLEALRVSYHELNTKFETKMMTTVQHEEDDLVNQLKAELETLKDRAEKDQQVISNLTAEKDALQISCNDLTEQHKQDVAMIKQDADDLTGQLKERVLALQHQAEKDKEAFSRLSFDKDALIEDLRKERDEVISHQEELAKELQLVKDENKLLQDEQHKLTLSCNQLRRKFEKDVAMIQHDADTLKDQLKERVRSLEHRVEQDQQVISSLTAERDALQMSCGELKEELKNQSLRHQELAKELQGQKTKNKLLQEEKEELRVSYNQLQQKYETEVSTLQFETQSLHNKMQKEFEVHAERMMVQQRLIRTLYSQKDELHKDRKEEVNRLKEQIEELKTQRRTSS